MRPGPVTVEDRDLGRARVAAIVVFVMNGLIFASIFARTPALRDTFGLSPVGLGLLLLCVSAGAVTGLPLSGVLVHRLGAGRTVAAAVVTSGLGTVGLAAGLLSGVVAVAGVGLVLVGLGAGVWDVAMNVEGAAVERALGRVFLPRLHAGFSVGAVGGAGVAAGCAALGVLLAVQLLAVAAVAVPVVMIAARRFLPVAPAAVAGRAGSGVLGAWREPRTVVLGLLVLAFAFGEGTAYDWLAVALVDGHGASQTVGAVGFGLFMAAMTLARLLGGAVLDRFGRVAVLRSGAVAAAAGLLLVILGGGTGPALGGAALWGAAVALGLPVGMSAAADDPALAAARVSVVSSVGYTAFLAGPPVIGLLAERDGVLRALLVVLVATGLAWVTAAATRPRPPSPTTSG